MKIMKKKKKGFIIDVKNGIRIEVSRKFKEKQDNKFKEKGNIIIYYVKIL